LFKHDVAGASQLDILLRLGRSAEGNQADEATQATPDLAHVAGDQRSPRNCKQDRHSKCPG
jgi:hypothetical protein